MNHYKISKYRYIKSPGACLVQGVKGNRRPSNSIRGSNGSFIVATPPSIMVDLKSEETGSVTCIDIYGIIKRYSTRKVTEKYASEIIESLRSDTIIGENGNLTNLEELISRYTS